MDRHAAISSNALILIGAQFHGEPCSPFNSDMKVRVEMADHTRFYDPDAMVVCDSNPPDDHFQDQPVVIVAVLNDSRRRTKNARAYLTILCHLWIAPDWAVRTIASYTADRPREFSSHQRRYVGETSVGSSATISGTS